MTTQVPLVDLSIQHKQIVDAVRHGFDRVFDETSFVLGPAVTTFERSYAEYCEVSECIGVGNGTDAIELALRAAGIGAGDEVILPANTFVATAEATVRTGATPVLVDCDENYLLDTALLERTITGRTRAVIGVDLYGQIAPIERIREVIGDRPILVVADGAQSHGARRHGRRAGSLADITSTSFYPGKNLGAYGDGGAVLTPDAELGEAVRRLRNHGGTHRYEHTDLGVNSRLDSLQAVVVSAKLEFLDEWNEQRKSAAEYYTAGLANTEAIPPAVVEGNEHVFHLYVVRVPDRDQVLEHLHGRGVGAGIHYPTPVHLLPAFASLGQGAGSHPVAERLAGEILSLPIYPGITREAQDYVLGVLQEALAGRHWTNSERK
jgi:dTDP-4-amino-4,6-dideoxygalactose transaminase